MAVTRRSLIATVLGGGSFLLSAKGIALTQQAGQKPVDKDAPADWVCPMDPDVRSDKPGACPRCGMKLVLHVPDRREFHLQVTHSPSLLLPNKDAQLQLRIFDPETGSPVTKFDLVHERLIHLFLVSENLEFFLHDHPVQKEPGVFDLAVRLPQSGMYRLLADFYPSGSVPQLALETLYVTGPRQVPHLRPALGESSGENLKATLVLDPAQPLAGLETKLFFTLNPSAGFEPYIGAWGHMLAASEDLIDLIHVHPFLADGGPQVQFNVIFPRPGLYRIWTQFQRQGVVNTVIFNVPVTAL